MNPQQLRQGYLISRAGKRMLEHDPLATPEDIAKAEALMVHFAARLEEIGEPLPPELEEEHDRELVIGGIDPDISWKPPTR